MKKKKTNGYDSVKNESLEKNSETQSSELIFKLKEKIDGEIINFSDSCDEITNKINDLIKNIDKNNNDLRDHRIIDEESDDESDEEEDEEITKSRKKGKHSKNKKDNKQKYSNFEEKNMFKNLNESFNKIVQNLDTKKFDNLSKKLNS